MIRRLTGGLKDNQVSLPRSISKFQNIHFGLVLLINLSPKIAPNTPTGIYREMKGG